jgi:hypothetical protein
VNATSSDGGLVPNHATFTLLDSYTDTLEDADIGAVKRQLQPALRGFPELNGRHVTVGRIPPSVEMYNDPVARARPYNYFIELPPGRRPTNMTLYHELAHLAIYDRYEAGDDVPRTSEEYTSLYALARMDPGDIYDDRIPYFGKVDASTDDWPMIAQDALDYRRENGKNSHYLEYARERFWEGGQ